MASTSQPKKKDVVEVKLDQLTADGKVYHEGYLEPNPGAQLSALAEKGKSHFLGFSVADWTTATVKEIKKSQNKETIQAERTAPQDDDQDDDQDSNGSQGTPAKKPGTLTSGTNPK